MNRLQIRPLAVADASALVGFETENRAFFEKWVPPRRPEYFDAQQLTSVLAELLTGEKASTTQSYLIYDEIQSLVGRINLNNICRTNGELATASVGYRVAQAHCGKGIAKAAVALLCHEAKESHGLDQLTAQAMLENAGSTRVLLATGFRLVPGEKEIVKLNGQPIELLTYARML